MSRQIPLRRELLVRFGFLFLCALLFALVGIVGLVPGIESTAGRTVVIGALIVIDFAVLFVLGSSVLGTFMVKPMELLADDASRIAGGDYDHRIRALASLELGPGRWRSHHPSSALGGLQDPVYICSTPSYHSNSRLGAEHDAHFVPDRRRIPRSWAHRLN